MEFSLRSILEHIFFMFFFDLQIFMKVVYKFYIYMI